MAALRSPSNEEQRNAIEAEKLRRAASRSAEETRPPPPKAPAWQYETGFHFRDALGAVLLAVLGGVLVWLALEIGVLFPGWIVAIALLLGLAALGLACLSALLSGFWLDYEDLSGGQYFLVRLPRNLVVIIEALVDLPRK